MTENKSIKEEVIKELSDKTEIQTAIESVGGQKLLKAIENDVLSSINEICSSYRTLSHIELVSVCARLSERFLLYTTMKTGIMKAKKMAQEDLDSILKEETPL
jgi:hypothetical protein